MRGFHCYLICFIFVLSSCVEHEPDVLIQKEDFEWAESEGVRNVLRRASQLALIEWIPVFDVPWNNGVFAAGSFNKGVPYSSTKQINKYVGLDVTFHTFMTAVKNPYSVLYTQNISKPPYNGTNCATYYGTVCSTLVDYALGFNVPYTADGIVNMPTIEKNPIQTLEYLKPGDIMHMPGHVFLIYRTMKDSLGSVTTVSYIEAGGRISELRQSTAKDFKDRLDRYSIMSYRYKDIDSVLDYTPSPYVNVGIEPYSLVSYNTFLCPERGDCCVYRENENIIINVMDNSFSDIEVKHTSGCSYSFPAEVNTYVGQLPEGMYYARAFRDFESSESISFYVANPHVDVVNNGMLHIAFSCTDCPALYCTLCGPKGEFYEIKPMTDEDREKGFLLLEPLSKNEYYCKVVFQTPYGTVVNNPVRVK